MPLVQLLHQVACSLKPVAVNICKLTDAMVSIEGEKMREVTWVVVEEVKSGHWGIGGKALTTADIKAKAVRKVR